MMNRLSSLSTIDDTGDRGKNMKAGGPDAGRKASPGKGGTAGRA